MYNGVTINGISILPDETGFIPENITEKVIELGVDANYIQTLSTRIMHKTPDFYDWDGNNSKIELVPTKKIIGFCINDAAESDVITTIRTGISSPERFYKCFSYLDGRTIADLQHDYETIKWENTGDKISLEYYTDIDGYIVTSGRHRCLTAILFNIPYIRASVITNHLNHEKAKWSKAVDRLRENYPQLKIVASISEYEAWFIYKGIYICMPDYRKCFLTENKYKVLENIEIKLENDIQAIIKLMSLPKLIRKIVLLKSKNQKYKYSVDILTKGIKPTLHPIGEQEINLYYL